MSMENTISAKESHALWAMLDSTYYAVLRARDKEFRDENILFTQCAVLARIKLAGQDASPSEIARRMSRERHSISQIIDRMEKAGLVRKVTHPQRKNGILVEITDAGEQVYLIAQKRKIFNRIISRLTASKRKRLLTLLTEVRQSAMMEINYDHF
jgi:DNA-binding MarR family transcriptional regulator